MIRISSEAELLGAFRSLERDEVQIPANFRFPLTAKDYLAWPEPSGHRVFLVFPNRADGGLLGVVFQRTRGPERTPASMCQWCHSVRSGDAVSLLTTSVSPNRRIGLYLCSALDCRENALSTPGVHDFSEGLSGQERVMRVVERMNHFAKRNLF